MNCGNARYSIGYIDYVSDMTIYIIIASIAATVGVLIIAALIYAWCKYKAKGPKEMTTYNQTNDDDLSYDDVRINSSDRRPFPKILSNSNRDTIDGYTMSTPKMSAKRREEPDYLVLTQ